jgi:hypothetical protein
MRTHIDITQSGGLAAVASGDLFSRVGLAFLQNMWVRDPQRVRDAIERYGEQYRMRVIHHSLFAGCLTGRRIHAAFGDELIKTITWEEASREIAGDSKTICTPDPEHIADKLEAYSPEVVITFGAVSFEAVKPLWSGPIIRAPHPAARQPETIAKLKAAASEYAKIVANQLNAPDEGRRA